MVNKFLIKLVKENKLKLVESIEIYGKKFGELIE